MVPELSGPSDVRRMVREPLQRPPVEGEHFVRRERLRRHHHPCRRLLDVDLVVEIETVGERHLVQEQVLGGEIPARRQPVLGRVVAVHAHVELPERIGDDVDVDRLRLLPVPRGERRDVGEIGGIADPPRLTRSERVLHGVQAGQVVDGEIRVAPELDALVEVVEEDVVQLVARYRGDECHGDQPASPQQHAAPSHDELAERHHRRIVTVPGRAHADGKKREQRRQKGHGEHERGDDPERDEGPELTERRHFGEVHAQEAERGGQAREEDRLKVHPHRFDDRIPLDLAGSGASEQGAAAPIRERSGRVGLHAVHEGRMDVDAVGDRDRQHDDRCDGGRRRHREPDPAADPHRGHDRQRDDEHDRERPAESPRQQHEHQRHRREARRNEYLEIVQRRLHEGLVEDHHPRHAHVDAGESFPDLACEIARELGDPGNFDRLVVARQVHGDVDAADTPVARDEACGEARFAEGDGADPRPLGGIAPHRLVHEVADQKIVAVGRGVLEVGDGVDAGRVRDLPGLLGEPGGGLEREGRRGVAVLRHDGEEDVAALRVGVLHRLDREELRIVLGEVHAVVHRELERQRAARGDSDQDQGDGDDRPPCGDDPAAESGFDRAHRLRHALKPTLSSPRFQAVTGHLPGPAESKDDGSPEPRATWVLLPRTATGGPLLTSGFSARAASGRRSSGRDARGGRGTPRAASRRRSGWRGGRTC